MVYNLGAVGLGHWFNRLYVGLRDSSEFRVAKVAGVSGVEKKIKRLREMGLTEADYYMIEANAPIPDRFYEGLDIVHISDPNDYHAEQTIGSLGRGKFTITEKTWGVNREEFGRVAGFIKERGLERRAYLHLHYLHKQLTLGLEELLSKYTREHGKVTRVAATLFEAASNEDARRRAWLFSHRSGGLFMDVGIHLFEVIMAGGSGSAAVKDVGIFAVNRDYDAENPTGIEADIAIEGEFFGRGACGSVRVAKGLGAGRRTVRFYFGSETYLDLEYLSSDQEYNSGSRGSWALYDNGAKVEAGEPSGPNNSEIFVSQILDMCRGKGAGLTLDAASALFEPQWKYQEMVKGMRLEGSPEKVNAFVSRGMKLE